MAGKSIYTDKIAEEICFRIASGESLRSVCRDDHMPDKHTVLNWLFSNKHPEFEEKYRLARAMQAEGYAEEICDIADNASNDWMERNDPDNPGYTLNGEYYQRSRLRVDARKWVASKLLPKKYGERTLTELIGNKENPIQINANVVMTADEAYRKMLDGD